MNCTAQDRGGAVHLLTELIFKGLRRLYASLLHDRDVEVAIMSSHTSPPTTSCTESSRMQ